MGILGNTTMAVQCLHFYEVMSSFSGRDQWSLSVVSVPFVRSELGKKAFLYAAPSDWNLLQSTLKLQNVYLANGN